MRFITLVKAAEHSGPPPVGFTDAMAAATDEAIRSGILIDTGGLAPCAQGVRVRVSGGKLTVTDGPFTEAKEVIGGYAVIETKSKEEAAESGVWLMGIFRDHWPGWEGEVEIREIHGPESLASSPEVESYAGLGERHA